jgi:plastocyanin
MVPSKRGADAERNSLHRRSLRRRSILRAGATALAATSVAGCLGATGDTGADLTTDETTDSGTTVESSPDHTATVTVGPDGELRFAPETLVVPPGTKLTWVWKSDTHNIAVREKPDDVEWTGTEGTAGDVFDAGHEHSHTFETTGTYEYVCVPHETVGMKGNVVVSESVDEPTTRESETTDPATETATAADLPVKVGPGGRLKFAPGTDRPLVVDSGTTVRFVWGSDNHNIVVHDQPGGANWEGTPGDYDDTYDEGYEYSHTFEVEGRYEFVCIPHETAGMVGSIVVEAE